MSQFTVKKDIYFGMWTFLWFVREAWSPIGRKKAIRKLDELFAELAKVGIKRIDHFLVVCTGRPEHKHLNRKTPWKIAKRFLPGEKKYKLHSMSRRWWKVLGIFWERMDARGLIPRRQDFMDRYVYKPFSSNVNNVHHFWSDNAMPFKQAFSEELCKLHIEVFGEKAVQKVKYCNEPAHWGNHDKFHLIGERHVEMWEAVYKKYMRLEDYHIDVSHCEAGYGEFDAHKKCRWCGVWMGNNDYLSEDGSRRVVPEVHGFSTPKSLVTPNDRLGGFLGSGTKVIIFSGDMGQDDGKGYRVPGTNFAQGDPKQTYDMVHECQTRAKAHPLRKRIVHVITEFQTFRDANTPFTGILDWLERNWKIDIAWPRLRSDKPGEGACNAHEAVHGE